MWQELQDQQQPEGAQEGLQQPLQVGKGHRVKPTTEEMIRRLDGMGEEERRSTVLAIVKKRPGILDRMTMYPFTITEICQVKLLLVFWVMLSLIFFSLLPCLPVFHVLDFFLLSILL